ncbi:S-methyl-5-thioribose-1-phosphate isomerase [Luteibaculum oceani]|uniref:Methylthioribose-1-phosphate isomerase n=1 Tax=Luteibaculum oceani TaxID=1294296 RepID=A0A5C6VJ62_9FLAO|nr:S-methyl-5-thioribose-1-phosphate isomerase [Luteibaculum oceani]TXC85267.1 S-methyl-5-thioribose-1-phosphate isomerase [Luteibaculum oceani]
MKLNGRSGRTIWFDDNKKHTIYTYDQRKFPHKTEVYEIKDSETAAKAIEKMVVRGAPLIGITAAFGVYLACFETQGDQTFTYVQERINRLRQTRPTAVNLFWALNEQEKVLLENKDLGHYELADLLFDNAVRMMKEDEAACKAIGEYGLSIIEELAATKEDGEPVHILTHCNAGWLACIDWGTATSPIYQAHEKGINVHVWVDETRPRNQGANLTAFELQQQGVPHHLITDNAGGLLMRNGMVDLVIVGADRVSRNGDVANKIGTYLKALAANDNHIPFYVALPSSTIDTAIASGDEIKIENRSDKEVKYVYGKNKAGAMDKVLICPEETPGYNPGFDITPAHLISGLITENGIKTASEEGVSQCFMSVEL